MIFDKGEPMALIKKNIWTLFFIVLAFSCMIFGFLLWNEYSNIKKEFIQEERNLNQVKSNSLKYIFSQFDTIFNILEKQLLANGEYKSKEKSRKVLDSFLSTENHVIAYALTKPDGTVYLTTSNIKNIEINLIEKEESRDSFLYTLTKNRGVLGRTYYINLNGSKKYIISYRKAIYDKKGDVLMVMSIIIDADRFMSFPKDDAYTHTFFRERDYFYQIYTGKDKYLRNYYDKPLPRKGVDDLKHLVEVQNNTTISQLKNDETIVSYEYPSFYKDQMNIAAVQYVKKLELWVITFASKSILYDKFYTKVTPITLVFCILIIFLYYLFKLINNSEQRKKNALEYQAEHDFLTRLHNQLYLMKKYQNKNLNPYTLFFIDMDNFKSVNDNYGHYYGDLVLKEIANRLNIIKKEDDVLIRYSGDEFLLIINSTDDVVIQNKAKEIISELSKTYKLNKSQFILGCSIGIAKYPQDGQTIDEVKRYADLAMYEAKKEKNSFCIFSKNISEKHKRNALIEEELKRGLEKNEFFMVYQPQVNSKGELKGVEALIRWENDKLGFVPPDEFISVAEFSGYMTSLGNFIINRSLKEIQELQTKTNTKFNLSINISVKQFMAKNFYEDLLTDIKKSNFPIDCITLEVTETLMVEDLTYIINLLTKLKELGMEISLDDFGTGYSSLSMLKVLPVDELKIDKSFVDDIIKNKTALNMAKNIIDIGENLELVTLAEGVEYKEQKELLDQFKCKLYQGYYYSKPLNIKQLEQYIKNLK